MDKEQEILELLLQRLDSPSEDLQIVNVREVSNWPSYLLTLLCSEGLLVPISPSALFTCTSCAEEHDEEVILVESPGGAKPRLYIECPVVGRVKVEPEDLRQWQLHMDGLLNVTARLLGINNTPKTIVPNRAWLLGLTDLDGHKQEVLLVRGWAWDDSETTLQTLPGPSIHSIIVLPFETSKIIHYLLPLSRIMRISSDGFSIDKDNFDFIRGRWNCIEDNKLVSLSGFQHLPDYRSVTMGGKHYALTREQAEVIKILHEAYQKGNPYMSWTQISVKMSENIDHYPARISDVFKDATERAELINAAKKNVYKLNL